MESREYNQLNPAALAIAAGVTAIILSFVFGMPMLGFGAMMNGYHGGGWMMGGFGYAGVAMWVAAGLVSALAGALAAWIYNAINVVRHHEPDRNREGGPQLPTAR